MNFKALFIISMLFAPFFQVFGAIDIKDSTTLGHFTEHKLTCKSLYQVINGAPDSRNVFIKGEKVFFFFDDLEGFEKTDDLVFHEVSMTIVSVEGDTVTYGSSLSDVDGSGTDMSPLQTNVSFIANFPQHKAEKYIAHIKIWDVLSTGKAFIKYAFPFSIVENTVLDIKSKGITYQSICLISKANDFQLVKPEVTAPDKLKLVFDRLDGLAVEDGVVFPSMSMLVMNGVGDTVVYQDNTMEEYITDGMSHSFMSKGNISITIPIHGDGKLNNPYHIRVILSDLKSENSLEINSELLIHASELNTEPNIEISSEETKDLNIEGSKIEVDQLIITANSKETTGAVFKVGEFIKIKFSGISGLTRKNGLSYPQMSILVINHKGDTMLSEDNMLASLKEGTDIFPLALQAAFRAEPPFEIKGGYKAVIKIWDTKGKGEYVKEIPFEVVANDLLQVSSKGISASQIYLWDATNKLDMSSKEITVSNVYYLVLQGMEGLNEIGGKVYPMLSVEMKNVHNEVLLSSENMLTEMSLNGITVRKLLEYQLPIELKFQDGEVSNPYQLKLVLKDKNSKKSLVVQTELNLVTDN
jgi:hypothetical protein